ncbi:MAG: hypothetical protein IJR88_02875 [Clostridia bacterium]|nr:hypothetical protein [Clostridia bacterium]
MQEKFEKKNKNAGKNFLQKVLPRTLFQKPEPITFAKANTSLRASETSYGRQGIPCLPYIMLHGNTSCRKAAHHCF